MPIYTYKCEYCDYEEDIISTYESMKNMENCGYICTRENCYGKMKRIITPCNFELKGSGWYKTDYKEKK